MGIPMQYITLAAEPLAIIESGYLDLSANVRSGEKLRFGELPEGHYFTPRQTLSEQLEVVFMNQTDVIRAEFYGYKAAVHNALLNNDIAAAKLIITNAPIPAELEMVRADLLALFPEEGN